MNIYVGNLSFETTEGELRNEFKKYGEVISVTIMSDKYIGSGQPRCYGYIEMASKSEATNAIAALEGKKLRNRVVNIVEALPLSQRNWMPVANIKDKYRSNKKRERKYRII